MNYKICKLKFQTEVHFGRNFLSDNEYSCYADTLFSALCHEYINLKGVSQIEKFVEYFRQNQLLISDAFPYINDHFFMPKPFKLPVKMETYMTKELKMISHIPVELLDNYWDGTIDVQQVWDMLRSLGSSAVHMKASVHGLDEANPYWVGGYCFAEQNGLYILIGYETKEVYEELKRVLISLSYTGIGGKITSGYGAFEINFEDVPQNWIEHLIAENNDSETKSYMTLSLSLPKNNELEKAMSAANYHVLRRGGFVANGNALAVGKEQKKQDLYVFQAGSCFENIYQGDIYDVSNGKIHPVYRYAKPMFWKVNL